MKSQEVWEKPTNCEISVSGNITWDILFHSIRLFTHKANGVNPHNLHITYGVYSSLKCFHEGKSRKVELDSKVCWVRLSYHLHNVFYLENPDFLSTPYLLKVNLFDIRLADQLNNVCKRRRW